jgi:hypothetical protein
MNTVLYSHKLAVAINPVEGIDKSTDEMPSSAPEIGKLASWLAVKEIRLTGHSLDMIIPLCHSHVQILIAW